MRKCVAATLSFCFGILLLVILIEIVAGVSVLPGTTATIAGLAAMWSDGTLQHNLQVSGARWLIGWSIGALVGVGIGFATGRVKYIRIPFEGFFSILRAIPFICLVPIAVRIFGLGESGKFFLVGWASATVSWVVTHEGARNIAPHYRWRALSLGASRRKWLLRVLFPAAAPAVFSALRASLSIGLIVVAIAEMSGVYERSSGYWWSGGLGYQMFKSLDAARDDLLMASVVTFAALGILGDIAFKGIWPAIALLTFRWRQRQVRVRRQAAATNYTEPQFRWGDKARVTIENLMAGYGNHDVIQALNESIAGGETLAIVGPSGCGKTTLLRAIGRFVGDGFRSTESVRIGEELLTSPGPRVGIVMQEALVFAHMTVWDNVRFGNWTLRYSTEEADGIVLFLLREFGLEEFATARAGTLSGGQRQRVSLATSIANQPDLLLLDEPFGALDAITRRRLQAFYNDKVHGHVSAVFVTHDVEEALIVGDRVRIGTDHVGGSFVIDKRGMPAHEWELGEPFGKLRGQIITALEDQSATRRDSLDTT